MAGDVFVSFGGDASGLEASLATAKSNVVAFSRELRDLSKEMVATGASADSELGQQVLATAGHLVEAKSAVSGFKSELRGAGEAAATEGGHFAQLREMLMGLTSPLRAVRDNLGELAEAFVAAFAVEKIAEFVNSMTELGEQASRTAAFLGISTADVSALDAEARSTGGTVEELARAMERLGLNLLKGEAGAKNVTAALGSLGLSTKQLIGIPAQEQIGLIAGKFAALHDGIVKDSIAMELFGQRLGAEMIPFLNKGADGIEEFNAMAERTGSQILPALAEQLEATKLGTIEMSKAWQGLGLAIYSEFRGPIDGAIKIINDLIESVTQSINQGGAWKFALDAVANAFRALETVIVVVKAGLTTISAVGVAAAQESASAFLTFGRVVADVFKAIAAAPGAFFSGVLTAGVTAAQAVGQAFVGLGTVILDVFKQDFSGAKAAFDGIGTDASAAAAKIKNSFGSGVDFSAVGEDMARGQLAAAMIAKQAGDSVVAAGKNEVQELKKIWTDEADVEVKIAQTKQARLNLPNPGAGKAAQEAIREAEATANAEVKAAQNAAKLTEERLNEQLKVHAITMAAWLAQTETALKTELDTTLSAYQKEEGAAGLKTSQIIALKAKEADAIAKYNQQIIAAEAKAAEQSAQEWKKFTSEIDGAFNSQISGLLKGTETFRSAFKNIIADLLTKFITFAADMALNWILQMTGMKAAVAAFNAAIAPLMAEGTATGAAAQKPGLAAAVTADSGEMLAGFTAFLAPTLGPGALAAAQGLTAAATAESMGLVSADIGGYVLSSGLANIHAGEEIVPARMSQPYSGEGRGGDTHNWNIGQVIGTQAFVNSMIAQITKAMNRHQSINPSAQFSW